MSTSPDIWLRYLESIDEDPATTTVEYKLFDKFGATEETQDKLFSLVKQGIKRATTGSVELCRHNGEPILAPGDLSILSNHDETEMCVLRTKKVTIKPFYAISEEDARIEGEGDKSLDYWKKAHREFFTAEYMDIGRAFTEDDEVIFEEFEMVYS